MMWALLILTTNEYIIIFFHKIIKIMDTMSLKKYYAMTNRTNTCKMIGSAVGIMTVVYAILFTKNSKHR